MSPARWLPLGLGCVLIGGLMGAEMSVPAVELDMRRARAFESFEAVLRADPVATANVRADLEAVLAGRPDDALARVHLGWLFVLEARSLPAAQARENALRGCALMDAAAAAAPRDLDVRLVRARSDYQVPLALHRDAIARADFAMLVSAARAPVEATSLSPGLRREILFHAGSFALMRRLAADAVSLLEAAAGVEASRPSDAEVQSMLALARRELSSQGHGEDAHPTPAPTATP